MYDKLQELKTGTKIHISGGKVEVPNDPIIPYVEGDGIGRDITKATQRVVNAAVEKCYGGKKKIYWWEIFAGDKAQEKYGALLPDDTIKAVEDYKVVIKGPLTTPVGGGFRSLNVTLRQVLDLYACVRPVKYYQGVPSPVKHPEKMNVIIFRENTEDVYAGIEWQAESDNAKKIIQWINDNMSLKSKIRLESGIGIKPISKFASTRLVRMAIKNAIANKRRSVTLVHKGNIMKYTEGAFRDWGYEVARTEFAAQTVTEEEVTRGASAEGKVIVKDRIADSMLQQILLRTDEYEVVATPNLNGDYLSDACAAQVGGLGIAPGANIGDSAALFEATHGTAPKYTDKDMVNPGSLLLSAVMMLEYMGWNEVGKSIETAFAKTIQQKRVTYDLARQTEGATELKTSGFASAIIENL
ncbi:MAG TPA: isocitrate dehydrogenase (NADP(+)) [Acidobacteriota bacterium]|nr:isocitrate dehydrogenase (NADP(+)) [Acidobacteriota bacterium]